jgi:hypothetical protein
VSGWSCSSSAYLNTPIADRVTRLPDLAAGPAASRSSDLLPELIEEWLQLRAVVRCYRETSPVYWEHPTETSTGESGQICGIGAPLSADWIHDEHTDNRNRACPSRRRKLEAGPIDR